MNYTFEWDELTLRAAYWRKGRKIYEKHKQLR